MCVHVDMIIPSSDIHVCDTLNVEIVCQLLVMSVANYSVS
jgi:hypothetical protein